MKLLVTTNAPLEFTAPADVEAVRFDEGEPVPAEHLDADAAVVVGGATSAVGQLARQATQLRWVQTLAAGPDGVVAAGFAPDVVITNGRGLHDYTVAETAVALALTGILRFPAMLDAQRERRWAQDEFGPWRELHPNGRLGSLIDTNVLIWGFGAIGQQTARLFQAMSARVRGVATSAGERAGFEVFTEADLPRLLPETDILVMVLPTSPETDKALNAARIALLPDRAWVINVGRGSTVDQEALAAALHAGSLGGAALDVVDPEPYPADGILWDCPNIVITPHVAGGVAHGSDALINHNLAQLRAGGPLRNVIDRS
ncbi:MAG: NAD(P)-dependent oxidoreductase [Actinomycetes bacterium]